MEQRAKGHDRGQPQGIHHVEHAGGGRDVHSHADAERWSGPVPERTARERVAARRTGHRWRGRQRREAKDGWSALANHRWKRSRDTPLAEPRGVRLRPTSGLVREAVFNILGDTLEGARVLDLYAGTGALGIEALSRGAAGVPRSSRRKRRRARRSCRAWPEPVSASAERSLRGKLPGALKSAPGPFDLVLMDPPYHEDTAAETLNLLAERTGRRAERSSTSTEASTIRRNARRVSSNRSVASTATARSRCTRCRRGNEDRSLPGGIRPGNERSPGPGNPDDAPLRPSDRRRGEGPGQDGHVHVGRADRNVQEGRRASPAG